MVITRVSDMAAQSVPIQPVLPAYDGAWIGAVVPALLDRADDAGGLLPAEARDADGVVLLSIDGLGWEMLRAHADLMPTLAGMAGTPITTVAPSTTSAALTSITTGATPAQHGILGYRIRVGGEVLNVLRWQAGEDTPDPERVQPQLPFHGHPIPTVTKQEFRKSAFSKAHLRGGVFTGWRTNSTMVEHCRQLMMAGHSLVYAYTDGVDKVSHEYGLNDGFLLAELRATEDLVVRLLEALPSSSCLVVIADHGQVQIEPEGHRSLVDLERLVAVTAGEGRLRTLWARPGASKDLLEMARELHGEVAWVRSRDEAFAEGWFGQGASAEVRGRVGDVILAAREPVIFVDRAMPKEVQMRSHHGSLTAAEMMVPLLAARGRA